MRNVSCELVIQRGLEQSLSSRPTARGADPNFSRHGIEITACYNNPSPSQLCLPAWPVLTMPSYFCLGFPLLAIEFTNKIFTGGFIFPIDHHIYKKLGEIFPLSCQLDISHHHKFLTYWGGRGRAQDDARR